MLSGFMPSAVVRLAFADDLKREVAQACGVTVNFIEAHKDNFRLILQGWGTEFRRQIHGDKYWVHRMERSIHRIQAASKDSRILICITDVRFENEAEMVKRFGGKVARVVRAGAAAEADNHISETQMNRYDFDLMVNNSGTLDDLRSEVERLAFQI